MKAITFLGAGTAHETVYFLGDGREHTARFLGVALAHFFPKLDMYVFVTDKARSNHWKDFEPLVNSAETTIHPVSIPDGRDEDEMWQIFERVIEVVNEGEQVVFDITHGFRSTPFLSFLAVAYLRVIKDIQLQAVLYGNFEARDQSVRPNRAPVIDLTPFVSLFDWMVAADRFIRFGDAHGLAGLVRAARPHTNRRPDPATSTIQRTLASAARAMDDVSQALRLLRPDETLRASRSLQTRLLNASHVFQTYARPFQPLAQKVIEAYAPLALPEDQDKNPIAALERERTMIAWYLDRQQFVQAVAVAREWLVSWAIGWLEEKGQNVSRRDVDVALGAAAAAQRHEGKEPKEPIPVDLTLLPQSNEVVQLFSEIGRVRNDLLHAGKRQDPLQSGKVPGQITQLHQRLTELTLPRDKS